MLFHAESQISYNYSTSAWLKRKKKLTQKIICFLKTIEGKTVICSSRGLLIIWRWRKEKEASIQQHIFNAHIFARQSWKPLGSLATKRNPIQMKHSTSDSKSVLHCSLAISLLLISITIMSHSQRMKPTGLKGYNFKHIKKQPEMTIISSLAVSPLTLVDW